MTMTLREQTEQHANKFIETLKNCESLFSGTIEEIEDSIPYTEPYGDNWQNYRYRSSVFRLAHVEMFFDGRYSVLHVTCFPKTDIPAPIFGFDMIGVDRANKYTASFFDLTPMNRDPKAPSDPFDLFPSMDIYPYDYASKLGEFYYPHDESVRGRHMPEWGEIFSSGFSCIRPHQEYVESIVDIAHEGFKNLIFGLYYNTEYNNARLDRSVEKQKEITHRQNRYCSMQSQNKKTFSVLKQNVGEENARHYMTEVLFPKCEE